MKDNLIQPVVPARRGGIGIVLLEAILVTIVGIALAFAANQISPQGLALARDYFPNGTNNSVRMAVGSAASDGVSGTNPVAFSSPQLLTAQMKQKELQLVEGHWAVQLFRDSHSQPESGIVFVDARDAEHYQEGHIPGAYEFDPYHPEKYFPTVLPVCRTAKQIVVYCNGGNCDDSETAALLLRDVGIANRKIFVYVGGITEWTNNRLAVETGPRNSGKLRNASQ